MHVILLKLCKKHHSIVCNKSCNVLVNLKPSMFCTAEADAGLLAPAVLLWPSVICQLLPKD